MIPTSGYLRSSPPVRCPVFLYTEDVFDFGPYWRCQTSTQTLADAVQEAQSGQLWGRAPKPNSGGLPVPAVKAWPRALPNDTEGIQFWAAVEPTRQWGGPNGFWMWELGSPGVLEIEKDTVAINIEVVRINQSKERL